MKTPTWAIVIGICIILLGGCSVTKNIQSIKMPEMLEMQQEMMEKISSSSTTNSSDSLSTLSKVDSTNIQNTDVFKNMASGMKDMFAMSEFTKTWTVRFGYIGLIVSIIYILSGVFLLIRKSFSIKLVCCALIVSIVFSAIQSFVMASDSTGGFMSKFAGFGNTFGIVIDIILFVVIISIDKSDYQESRKEIEQPSI